MQCKCDELCWPTPRLQELQEAPRRAQPSRALPRYGALQMRQEHQSGRVQRRIWEIFCAGAQSLFCRSRGLGGGCRVPRSLVGSPLLRVF